MAKPTTLRPLAAIGAEALRLPQAVARARMPAHTWNGCDEHPRDATQSDVVASSLPLVEGDSLREDVTSETLARLEANGNRLPIPISVAVARGLLHRLAAAHDAHRISRAGLQVFHANIDPQNILVGGDGMVRLVELDHAGAKRAPSAPTPHFQGKGRYLAPEQVFEHAVDARTEVFRVGIVLWESLTGRPLIAGGSAIDCMLRFVSSGAKPPSEVNPEVGKALDAVLLCALEPTPERRFQSATAFAQALEAAAPPAPRPEVGRYVQAVTGAWVQERPAIPDKLPAEKTPTTGVRLTSPFREVSKPAKIVPSVPDAEEPTAALGQFLDEAGRAEAACHWSCRDADELTIVDGAPERPKPQAAQHSVDNALGRPGSIPSQPAPAEKSPSSPQLAQRAARPPSGSEPEIEYSADLADAREFTELADAFDDFDESWVHPPRLLKSPPGERPSGLPQTPARRFARGVLLGIVWSVAFVLVFATTFLVTKTVNDVAYRARSVATLDALLQRVLAPGAETEKVRAAPRNAATPRSAAVQTPAPRPAPIEPLPSAESDSRVLQLEELPLAPEEPSHSVTAESKSQAKRRPAGSATSAPKRE